MVQTDSQLCQKCTTMEKGQRVLRVESLKALHGLLKSALSFYRKFVADVKDVDHELNDCDLCIANKIANGKQHTLVWHVDDVKASHIDPEVNDGFMQFVKDKCGGIGKAKAE